jgi:hypothetical protein
MFKKTKSHRQLNLLSNVNSLLNEKSSKEYIDNKKWHNQFRVQVLERIDEELFRPLFCSDNGAPNASIRVLIGMMILKEAHCWSDSQLFENSNFNLVVRNALGFVNIDDSIPAASTYYLLRKRIVDWEVAGNGNLIEKVFSQVTRSQVLDMNINGKKIRMDSTLLGSNIACYSRYELIHETLSKAYNSNKSLIDNILFDEEISILKELSCEFGGKVSYRSNKSELEEKLIRYGYLIFKIISHLKNTSQKPIQVLRQVFYEQYEVIGDIVNILPKQAIKANSIQSPHDTDCDYRKKGDVEVKGYSINVTETCDSDNPVNLMTNVIVAPASISDCDFLQSAVEATQAVSSQEVETIHSDGAYYSIDNHTYCQENAIDNVLSGLSGQKSRFDISFDDGKLIVTDTVTNTIMNSWQTKSKKPNTIPNWAFHDSDGKYHYITQHDIDTRLLRKQIETRPKAELNIRNNVEASVFQLGFHYRSKKSRYRGVIKHIIWANARCLWINFRRIMKYVVEVWEKADSQALTHVKYALSSVSFCLFSIFYLDFCCSK